MSGNDTTTAAVETTTAETAAPPAADNNLKGLLASLAAFARAAQSLPAGAAASGAEDNDDNDNGDNDDGDDGGALEFEASFPEFRRALRTTQESLWHVLQTILAQAGPAAESEYAQLEHSLHDLDTASSSSQQRSGTTNSAASAASLLDDPWLWERAAECCDALVEQVEAYLSSSANDDINNSNIDNAVLAPLRGFAEQARGAASASKWNRIVANTAADWPKPQDAYHIQTTTLTAQQQQQQRTQPFVPAVHPGKPFAVTPLDLTLRPGHGHDTRFGALRPSSATASTANSNNDWIIAPAQHCPHPYETEIQSFHYTPRQLEAAQPASDLIPIVSSPLQAEWIGTEPRLAQLAAQLLTVTEMALDLEAHAYRSFAGLVCLVQISVRVRAAAPQGNNDDSDATAVVQKNYLIDALALHHCLNRHLAAPLANPAIVKVLHGADHDVQWLQRDFGLYIVNLFDTGRAARQLQLPSAGYAHLLQKYAGIDAAASNKAALQLADWRVRPLTAEMQQYAIQDTHYLLDIYDRLKWDLWQQHRDDSAIRQVLDTSRLVCLIRYTPEPFDAAGYQKLLRGGRYGSSSHKNSKNELQPHQEEVLRALWDWRDRAARNLDESVHYVATPAQLRRLALAAPTSTAQLQSLFHPLPPVLARQAAEVTQIIQRAVAAAAASQQQAESSTAAVAAKDDEDDAEDVEVSAAGSKNTTAATNRVGAPSSAFFKPASGTEDAHKRRSGMLSPVLGTEALYQQAGWTTPSAGISPNKGTKAASSTAMTVDGTTTTTDEDEDDDVDVGDEGGASATTKPKKLLSVHPSNRDYRAAVTEGSSSASGRTADGMGSARSGGGGNNNNNNNKRLEEQGQDARDQASRIQKGMSRQKQSIPTVLGLVASSDAVSEEDDAAAAGKDDQPDETGGGGGGGLEQDFRIPRSIREIYMISNRNRRYKKTGTPTPERGVTPTSEKEREELARAEALLREHGVEGYFDEDSGSPKRPRTKSEESSSLGGAGDQSAANVNMPSKDEDVAFMKDIGWIKGSEDVEGLMTTKQRQGRNRGGKAGYDAGSDVPATVVGVTYNPGRPNPFFAGAALQGGPLTQQQQQQQGGGGSKSSSDQQRTRRGSSNSGTGSKGKQNRSRQQQERPEKKDSRTHAYRKR